MDYSFRSTNPLDVLRNAYGAAVNGLKGALQPGGRAVGMVGASPEERLRRISTAVKQMGYESRHGAGGDPSKPYREKHFTEMLPTDPQEVTAAVAQAGLGAGFLSRGFGAGARSGTLNTFLGPESATANLDALAAAKQFEKAGVPSRDIWKTTGWGKGPDGNWIYEISDEALRVKPAIQQHLDDFERHALHKPKDPNSPEWKGWVNSNAAMRDIPPAGTGWGTDRELQGYALSGRVGDMVDHPELFKALPGARDMNLSAGAPVSLERLLSESSTPKVYGSFNPTEDRVRLMRKLYDHETVQFSNRGPLVHELQHGAQVRGGRSAGASVANFGDDLSKGDALRALNTAKEAGGLKSLPSAVLADPDKLWAAIKDLPRWQLGHKSPEDVMKAVFGKPRTAYEKYRAVPGELESFATQQRLNWTPEARRNLPPWEMPEYQKYNTMDEFNRPVESFLQQGNR